MRRSAIARAGTRLACALVLTLAPILALAAGQSASQRNNDRLLVQADEAIQALHWSDAVVLLKKVIASEPGWRVYQKLGHAEFNLAQYQDAVAAFTSAVDLAKAETDDPATGLAIAQMLTEQGNVYLKLHDYDGAMTSYRAALPFSEKYPVAFFNVCALDYNQGKIEMALADCNAAIKADPGNADAYFIKGSLLFANVTMNADGKMTASPEALDALNMYLQLAPNGSHALDVREMLDSLQ